MSTELAYLQLQAAKGIGPARQRKLLQLALESGKSLEEFLTYLSLPALSSVGLGVAQLDSLASARKQAESWATSLSDKDIKIVGLLDDEYPKALKKTLGLDAPPVLAVWGNTQLLEIPAVGFCGARDASEQGTEFAKDAAQQVVQHGWVVVAGNARGIDAAAHWSALQNDGYTIIVAPSGILDVRLHSSYRDIVNHENVLVLSEFQPDAHWSVSNAMTRNKTICGLSVAMIIVESGLRGGTFEAGEFTLGIGRRLFVADYSNPSSSAAGNQHFLQKGALPIRKSKSSGRANMAKVFEISELLGSDNSIPSITQPIQLSLLKAD